MIDDAIKWDKKYKAKSSHSATPDSFFLQNTQYIQGNTILDLAGGDGKNALYFASQGYKVSVLDISTEGISRLEKFSSDMNLTVSSILMDLDDITSFQELEPFDNIIISFFKPSPKLFKVLHSRLKPRGRIFLHSFSLQQHFNNGFPRKFCLEDDEYLNLCPHLELISQQDHDPSDNYLKSYIFEKI